MQTFEETIQKLRRGGFKLTPQRLAVIRHMLGNKTHPSALSIHRELRRRYPTLSFSTVYNTLGMLEKIEEVRSLHVFDDYLNYDSNTEPHIHFICSECGAIDDIMLEDAIDVRVPRDEIAGHRIDTFTLVFKGTCKSCR